MIRVKFTCTARKIHRRVLLGEAEVTDDGAVTFVSRGPSEARGGHGRPRRSNLSARVDPDTGDYGVYRLLCPSCPIHVEWRRSRAEAIARVWADEARRAGLVVASFDVSNMS